MTSNEICFYSQVLLELDRLLEYRAAKILLAPTNRHTFDNIVTHYEDSNMDHLDCVMYVLDVFGLDFRSSN